MNILIIRVSSLGDVVHTMPMVADIHRHFPKANIDWVVEEAYVDLVKLNPYVRKIIPFALRRWRKSLFNKDTRGEMKAFYQHLTEEKYDVVFDAQGLLKTGVIMGLAKIVSGGEKIGLANATLGSGYEGVSRIFHNKSVRVDVKTPAVQRSRILAGEGLHFGVASTPEFNMRAPEVNCPALPTVPYVVFFHGTAGATKKWDPEHWIAVGQRLKDYPILLPWGNQAEKEAAEQLAAHIPSAKVLPKLPMLEAVALAQRAALVIGLDTGLTHIAAAYCRPTIELYCDSPRWKTEGDWSDKIINLGDQGTPPTVDQVIQAIVTLGF